MSIASPRCQYPCSSSGWNPSQEATLRGAITNHMLTYWGRDKIYAIWQTTFSIVSFFNKNVWILLKVSLKFVPKVHINSIPALVQIIACHLPFGAYQATSHYLNQWRLVYGRIYASLGLNELTQCNGDAFVITESLWPSAVIDRFPSQNATSSLIFMEMLLSK